MKDVTKKVGFKTIGQKSVQSTRSLFSEAKSIESAIQVGEFSTIKEPESSKSESNGLIIEYSQPSDPKINSQYLKETKDLDSEKSQKIVINFLS